VTVTSPASGAFSAADLPDCVPIPRSALGPALNDQDVPLGVGYNLPKGGTDARELAAGGLTREVKPSASRRR